MQRIEKIETNFAALAAVILFASIALSACTTDPSPRTYLDWNLESHPQIAAREEAAPHRANWPGATYYTVVVRPGDSVSEIAARYDVAENAVRRMNNIGPRGVIRAGDVLRIPPGSERTREIVLGEVSSPKIYATPRDTDYVEEHPLAAPVAAPPRAPHPVTPRIATPAPKAEEQASYTPPGDMRFIWPVSGHIVSGFGGSNGERNDGIDIAAAEGSPVRAAAAGTVTYAGNELRQYGNLIIIKHADGYITVYAHEANIGVKKGDQVGQGQVIGTAGATGGVEQPELHFEVRYNTKPVNPRPLLSETVARASS
jgi:murein DD-endopeptidase MepM/ murein hydrolase activator NlpD